MITKYKLNQWYAFDKENSSEWLKEDRADSDKILYEKLKDKSFKSTEINAADDEIISIITSDGDVIHADDFDQACLFNYNDKAVLNETGALDSINSHLIKEKLSQIEALMEEIKCLL